MPLGDSITESKAGYSSYRLTLWNELRAAGCTINLVGSRRGVSRGFKNSPFAQPRDARFDLDHEGHWAYRTDEILQQLDTWLAKSRPDVVLVHLGSNDIISGQSNDSTAKELGQLIDEIRDRNPRAIIIMAQLIPARRRESEIVALNRKISSLATSKNTLESPVKIVNLYRDFSIARELQGDGVHPNRTGDIKIGKRFAAALLQSLPRRSF
jgi:acyl-CoA thioesterase-1